jgi:hypothetical protein
MDAPSSTATDAAPVAPQDQPEHPSTPRSRLGPPDWRTVVSVAVVAAFVALPLQSLRKAGGSPMEEGFMLVFPERLLAGDVPNKDFLHLYGPGSLWALGATYELLGTSIGVERIFGLVQQLGIIFGVFTLALPWGRKVATVCGVMSVLITVTPIGLTALAWDGAVALGLWGLIVGLWARRAAASDDPDRARRADRLFLVAGLLGAGALLFRPDLLLAIGLGYGALVWGQDRAHIKRLAIGLVGLTAVGYIAQLAMAGPGNAIEGMFLEPVFKLRDGRTLPAPPSWDHFDGALAAVAQLDAPGWSFPAFKGPQQVVLWFFLLPLAALLEVVLGALRVRARPESWRARVMLAAALFGMGMLPQAIQRPDTTHLSWVSCVPLALLPLYLADLVRSRFADRAPRVLPSAVAAVAALAILFGVMPHFTVRPWTEYTREVIKRDYSGHQVQHGGRVFYVQSEPIAPAVQGVVDEVGRRAEPGDRLLVGTADLRKTPYSDAYIYYLLPELTPATRYIEMDPGMANTEDSGLAEEVAGADWLILSHVWDPWREPNASREFGSDAPNKVVEENFCLVDQYGDGPVPYFLLYERCR